LTSQHALQDADTIQSEVGAEKSIQQEQLTDDVADVEQLDKQVGAGEVRVVVDVAKSSK